MPVETLSSDPLASITGTVIEAGDLILGSGKETRNVVLECGERNVEVIGLDEDEARALGRLLYQEVILRITPVSKP